MTFVLGGQCSDGVFILGDRKYVTPEDPRRSTYADDKVVARSKKFILGTSGVQRYYDLFSTRFEERLAQREVGDLSGDEILFLCEEAYNELENISNENLSERALLELAIGIRTADKAELYLLGGNAGPVEVANYLCLGTGRFYAEFFLKKLWKSNDMTVNEGIALGVFLVKYIEYYGLDHAVGLNNESPIVYELHDSHPECYRQTNPSFLSQCLTQAGEKIKKIEAFVADF